MNAAVMEDRAPTVGATTAGATTAGSAIAALLTHSGPVFLDFDETLYLQNSTEDFLDSARPAVLALLVLRLLDVIKPWRWTGGELTRDVWRIRCIMLLFPWTKDLWVKRVRSLAATAANTPLIAALQKRAQQSQFQPAIIATLGFDFVVAPLAAALGLPNLKIIAARATSFADRREGKLRMVVSRVGNETVRRSLVLTDSTQDKPLLDACAVPLLFEWPQAHFRPAFSDLYLPGQYLTLVKRPGERYVTRGILQEDFALWVLASISLALQPIAHVAGLLFLLLSFWTIYEAGYVDNDRIGARFERDPKLSRTFGRISVATPTLLPWLWAAVSGCIGVLLLRGFSNAAVYGFAAWGATLAATYGVFALYNRLDKASRIWWYSLLQLARSAAFIALVPIHLVGALAIGAHILAKWMPYYMYRIGGKNWPERSHFLTRLLFFALLTGLVGFATGFASIWSWSTLALLAWNIFRARHELLSTVFDATRIDKESVDLPSTEKRSPP